MRIGAVAAPGRHDDLPYLRLKKAQQSEDVSSESPAAPLALLRDGSRFYRRGEDSCQPLSGRRPFDQAIGGSWHFRAMVSSGT